MPLPLCTALSSLFLQGLGLIALAGWLVYLSLTHDQTAAGAGFAEAVVCVGAAALLIAAANTMRDRSPGMRGLAVFSQLAWLPVGYFLFQAELTGWGVAAWCLGLFTVALLVVRSTRSWLGVDVLDTVDDEPPSDQALRPRQHAVGGDVFTVSLDSYRPVGHTHKPSARREHPEDARHTRCGNRRVRVISVSTMKRYLVAAFAVVAVANLVSVGIGNATLEWVTKPLLMPLLALLIVVGGGLAHHHARLMVLGLAAATIADVALLIPGQTAFLAGMGFFLIMQVCYIRVFLGLNAWSGVKQRVWVVAAPVAILFAFFIPLWTSLGPLAGPMLVYGTALAFMAVCAMGLSLRAGVGGVLFLISDLLIGVNVAGHDFTGRSLIIMSTYIAAQYLLVTGWAALAAAATPTTPASIKT